MYVGAHGLPDQTDKIVVVIHNVERGWWVGWCSASVRCMCMVGPTNRYGRDVDMYLYGGADKVHEHIASHDKLSDITDKCRWVFGFVWVTRQIVGA